MGSFLCPVQQETPATQNNRTSEYQEILKSIREKSKQIQNDNYHFNIFNVDCSIFCSGAAYYIKTNQSPIGELTNYLFSISEKAKTEVALKELKETLQALSKNKNPASNEIIQHSENEALPFTASAFNYLLPNSSPSRKNRLINCISLIKFLIDIIYWFRNEIDFGLHKILYAVRY
ncbi:hypothetical protein ACHWWK_20000 [Klebsiella pneumoniae]